MSFIDDVVKKAGKLIDDTATLDVITFTGDVTIELKGDGSVDFDKLHKGLLAATQAGPAGGVGVAAGSVNLVAFTHVQADMDAVLFVKDNLTAAQTALLESHRDMVRASQDARNNLVKAAASIVKGIF